MTMSLLNEYKISLSKNGVEVVLLHNESLCSVLYPIINLASKVGFKTKVGGIIVV